MVKFNKILFLNTLALGTLISISSYSWLSMWFGLEINLLSMIPLMNNSTTFNSEAIMKYFLSQAMASMFFLFSILMLNIFSLSALTLILNSSLLTKMGMAPFHFWFPQVMEGLNWNLSLLMLTWQKIAPFVLVSYNIKLSSFTLFVATSSSIVGSIMGLNQISMRKILAYSSINHMSWMVMSMTNSISLWLIYLIVYCLISFNIIIFMKTFNIFYMKQLILKISPNKQMKMFFMMNFFSLAGLPPFLGFLPKWFTINTLMNNNLWMISLILISFSLVTLFFYTRLTLSGLMINLTETLNFSQASFSNWKFTLINFINLSGLVFLTLSFNLN
uniref:NADH-ubiquinone oxidoreductase chain 2 n=1 Tax=Curculionoidea sp. 24 KM-2017 TaxID=2219408 RepID=A0A346RKJ4_9CUCU|nr:NADH dehydrogenase subunit 2 [Curculionoidea sp. 24 KM-2017]